MLYLADIKVLKDALTHSGPYKTLMSARYYIVPCGNTVIPVVKKNTVKIFSTNQDGNLVLLDDPGRVRSQIISVVCQKQLDFDCNL